jgi:RND family efflux transporter MFP subunit
MTSTIPSSAAEKRHPAIWLILKILLPIALIILGYGVMKYMIATAPKAGRQAPPRTARLVEVRSVAITNASAVITAMGVVHPAREVTLHPQISGTVIAIGPELIPGGLMAAGDAVVHVDRADYAIALRRAEGDLALARSDFALESGQQALARKEFVLLGQEELSAEERALILREPQKARAEAMLESAAAALDQAKLNMERTAIAAPFHAVVRERHVDVGAQVNPSTPLATLTDVDTYWIIAPVPVSQLSWLTIPSEPGKAGSNVRVRGKDDAVREARILRLLNELEKGGRMAQLLIEAPDPLALKPENRGKPKLLIGDFVRMEIEGSSLENVIVLDRSWVRNHDDVWVMNERGELEIRKVTVVFRGEQDVYVRGGLAENERIITTDLSAPVNGMKVTTGQDAPGGTR